MHSGEDLHKLNLTWCNFECQNLVGGITTYQNDRRLKLPNPNFDFMCNLVLICLMVFNHYGLTFKQNPEFLYYYQKNMVSRSFQLRNIPEAASDNWLMTSACSQIIPFNRRIAMCLN